MNDTVTRVGGAPLATRIVPSPSRSGEDRVVVLKTLAVNADGQPVNEGTTPGGQVVMDRDTNGDPVPTYKAHTFTYDDSGNLKTDTVSDGSDTWVRTYTFTNGQQTNDSGWVKQ